ncbi:sulfatase-like hydrolase/transferase [Candidatus Poribacteria bacterium]|nr:sulfatase-like hydrolase/transferase [Candidatus Poribacteria bacterium]
MTDTQGTNVVGCYGRPELNTPNIDNLAEQGIRFDRAYTACPVCGPARSAIFTGTYPHTNGSWGNDMDLGANIKTVGQRLRDNGLQTAYIGKWHLDGTDYFGSGICPDGWKDEYWFDMRRYLEEMPPEDRKLSRELNTPEKIHKHNIAEDFTYGHKCSNRAIDFLSKYGDDDFILVVSYDEPHGPFTCPPPYCDMFLDYEYPLGKNVADTMEDKPAHQQEWARAANLPKDKKTLKRAMYFGCNSFVDYQIGRVLKAVDEYASDALVIYTSDHGTPLLSHGLNSKGPAMYDETTRVPFIVRWPGSSPEKAVCSHPVSHIDVVPTILDFMGMDSVDYLEGKSMLETFRDPDKQPNDNIFIEFNRYEIDHDGWGGFQPIRCAFDGRHKLVINLHYTDELYDLQNDPEEMKNLINSPEYAEVRDNLHQQLLEWINRTRDPFRAPVWERRQWKTNPKQRWGGPTRPRPDDGYLPRVLLYETGLEIEKYTYDKN